MKRITPVILTAFTVFALSFSTFANNTDSDGFIIFEAETSDAPQTASSDAAGRTDTTVVVNQSASSESATEQATDPEPAAKQTHALAPAKKSKAKKKKVTRKRAKRTVRKKRNTRAKRAKHIVRKKRNTKAKRSKRTNSLKRASTYRVRKGDTLYRISVRSGVSLSRLIRLNNLHGRKQHKIQAGQKIRLR